MICAIFFWFLFGWLADYSFPFGQALELMLSCFTGNISARINKLQKQLQRTDIVSQPDNKQQVAKLNNLESQAWLYESVLLRLGEDAFVDHEKIARTLEALEFKRNEILQELKPRRPKRYRFLAGIQDSARELLASKAEKDYEQLQKIVTNTVLFARDRKPSPIIISEVIDKLATEITQNKNKISPYRLRLAYKVDELIKILSAKLVLGSNFSETDSNYQSLVNELRSQVNLLSKEFNNLLRAKQEDKNELNRRIQEISALTKNISNLHRDISNRDADIVTLQKNIQELRESARSKQTQIDNLQDSISDLQRDIQNSDKLNQRKESQINQLQNQLSKLSEEKINFDKIIEDLSDYIRVKELELENLHNEIFKLNSDKSDIQHQYQNLYQSYQIQQNEIANLNKRLEDKAISTEEKISEEEYQKISNQSEYEYVSGYPNSRSGKWVEAYYRRRKKKRR